MCLSSALVCYFHLLLFFYSVCWKLQMTSATCPSLPCSSSKIKNLSGGIFFPSVCHQQVWKRLCCWKRNADWTSCSTSSPRPQPSLTFSQKTKFHWFIALLKHILVKVHKGQKGFFAQYFRHAFLEASCMLKEDLCCCILKLFQPRQTLFSWGGDHGKRVCRFQHKRSPGRVLEGPSWRFQCWGKAILPTLLIALIFRAVLFSSSHVFYSRLRKIQNSNYCCQLFPMYLNGVCLWREQPWIILKM